MVLLYHNLSKRCRQAEKQCRPWSDRSWKGSLILVYTICSDLSVQILKIIMVARAAAWPNQQNDLCAQQRLRSAWASAQSDQSLRCPSEESLGPKLPIMCTAKALIRLGGICPGWSESSLCVQVLLLDLSCGDSILLNLDHQFLILKWDAFSIFSLV